MRLWLWLALSAPALMAQGAGGAENAEPETAKASPGGRFNLVMPTLGGRQFWADEMVVGGWRIQQCCVTGHHRLLDPSDFRRAWGSFDACRAVLERELERRSYRPRSDHLVVLVHGMGRSRHCFHALARALRAKGYEVAAVTYPSTMRSIDAHADQLARVLERTRGARSVSFVTHSLGGLVVRELLARQAPWQKKLEAKGLVMLGAPNRGSQLAAKLEGSALYRLVTGPLAEGLTPRGAADIPEPTVPFGVIAGGNGIPRGKNAMIRGDNDGVVAVADTVLPEMADFLLVDSIHTLLVSHPEVIRATLAFLATGRF